MKQLLIQEVTDILLVTSWYRHRDNLLGYEPVSLMETFTFPHINWDKFNAGRAIIWLATPLLCYPFFFKRWHLDMLVCNLYMRKVKLLIMGLFFSNSFRWSHSVAFYTWEPLPGTLSEGWNSQEGTRLSDCCGASVASEQQHNQDLKRIKKGVQILEFITFYQNALHLTRVHCTTFYQSALHHELHEDVTPSSHVDSSEKGLMVVMFCSDLPVKRCEGDRAWLS